MEKYKYLLKVVAFSLFILLSPNTTVQASSEEVPDLYLQWEPNEVTVTFDSNGGGTAPEEQTYTYGESETLPGVSSMSKTGYTFIGWSETREGSLVTPTTSTTAFGWAGTTSENTKTLYAQWRANTITIHFDANTGTGTAPEDVLCTYDEEITLPAKGSLTKTGYTFMGWATTASATSPMTTTTSSTAFGWANTSSGSKTLYAVWKANTVTVTFDSNGGGTAPSVQTYTYDVSGTLPGISSMSKTGYTFMGWATTSSASTPISNSSTTAFGWADNSSSNTKTLYAIWKANTVTVTFNSNGGGTAPSTQTYTYGTSGTLPGISSMSKTGYTFKGWAESSSATIAMSNSSSTAFGWADTASANTKTLYAVWKANTVTITFNSNGGGTAPSAQTYTYGTSGTLPGVGSMSKTNCNFQGWAESSSASSALSNSSTTAWGFANSSSSNSKTLYAVWTVKPNISYSCNSYSGTVDGSSHTITLNVSTSGCTVRYGTSSGSYTLTSPPSYSTKGSYTVYFKITKSGYKDATGSANVILRNPNITSSSQVNDNGNAFDIKGNGGSIQTTFGNGGYHTYFRMSGGSETEIGASYSSGNITVTRSVSTNNEYGHVMCTYTIRNTSSSAQSIDLAVYADAMVNGNDRVPIYTTSYGFYAENTYRFAYYLKNTEGVTDTSTIWVGQLGGANSGKWTNNYANCSGVDTGISWSWQNKVVPANGSITITWMMDMI